MPTLKEILGAQITERERITALKQKTVSVPAWTGVKGLQAEYDPTKHPDMNKGKYPDVVRDDGIEYVTRISLSFQKLAA